MRTLKYFLLSLLFLSSCDKFDWHNPYDPECPKELFTPSSPGATMEGNSVKLTWSQSNDDISGFALYRSTEGEPIANLTQTQKSTTQYLDASITPGKKYTYYVLAVAGTNKSDTIKAEITPVFPITITTGAITELGATSAKVSGNITSAGGGTVTSRGICWSTTQNPTVNNSKTTEGTGTGQYTSTLSGLLAGTTYYARAYGENSRGIVYGSQVSFNTIGLPLLTTTAVSNITATSATSGGTIISDGGSPITAKGVVWSTSPNPTIDLTSKTNDGAGLGMFTSTIANLVNNTKYYIRAFMINSFGVYYGEEFSFTTLGGLQSNPGGGVTDIEGNLYKTVRIGNQEWMAENLKVTKLNDGTSLQYGNLDLFWNGVYTIKEPVYTWYSNDINNKEIYGGLYNWYTVNTNKICPIGWHVPSDAEWSSLETYLGGRQVAGGKLKQTGISNWQIPNWGATNETGFTSLPAGNRYESTFSGIGVYGTYWTSATNSENPPSAIYRQTHFQGEYLERNVHFKVYGVSIRCLKD